MTSLLLVTFLSCSQVVEIANRVINVSALTMQQKTEILNELRRTIISCPIVIKSNDGKKSL